MEKLISMTDFVLEQRMKSEEVNNASFYEIQSHIYKYYDKIFAYANFLKQPLNLGMFVPCDENDNVYIDYHSYQPKLGMVCEPYQGLFEVIKKGKDVELLNEPQFWKEDQRYYNKIKYDKAFQKYQEAKQRVLFEGFEFIKKYPNNCIRFKFKGHFRNVFLDKVNIENLICFDKDGMTLSESAKQQLS